MKPWLFLMAIAAIVGIDVWFEERQEAKKRKAAAASEPVPGAKRKKVAEEPAPSTSADE